MRNTCRAVAALLLTSAMPAGAAVYQIDMAGTVWAPWQSQYTEEDYGSEPRQGEAVSGRILLDIDSADVTSVEDPISNARIEGWTGASDGRLEFRGVGYSLFGFGSATSFVSTEDGDTLPGSYVNYTAEAGDTSFQINFGNIQDLMKDGRFPVTTTYDWMGFSDPDSPSNFTLGEFMATDASGEFLSGWVQISAMSVQEVGDAPAPVPLPAALPLVLTGLGAMAVVARRRKG